MSCHDYCIKNEIEFQSKKEGYVAVSCGPYGAILSDGSEYRFKKEKMVKE